MNLDKKIGETSKGFSRIYLEGSILSENGFNVGDRYEVIYKVEGITLSTRPHSTRTGETAGTKKVSKKVKNGVTIPVIDLCDGKKKAFIKVVLGGKNAPIFIEGNKTYETLLIKKG